MRRIFLLFPIVLSCTLAGGAVGPMPRATPQAVGAIHVHSRFSNGDLSVEELARLAEEKGVDLLVLTDSLLTRVTYGLWPLDRIGIPGLNTFSRPSVLDHGMDRYLDEIRAARERHPGVVIVAGVEVAPAWYWEGSPWSELTLHGFDRHLLVLGLTGDEMQDLPVAGNESWSNTEIRWSRVVLPLLLLAAGSKLLLSRSPRRLINAGGLVLAFVGTLVAWNNYPFGLVADPGARRHDVGPYQSLIDWVERRGGLVYWAYPEAKYGNVSAGGATMVSGPHAEDLLETEGYDGFEGLYGDEITVTAPGGIWDRSLIEHLAGRRARPPFVITGIDYHGPKKGGDGWDEIDGGRTMVLMEERTEEAALAALRRGRAYATFQAFPRKWRLADFTVSTADGSRATHGEGLSGPSPVTISWAMDWIEGAPEKPVTFRFDLIRNGTVIETFSSPLPIRGGITQELTPGRYYFRAMADAHRLNRLLTNPVFVTVE